MTALTHERLKEVLSYDKETGHFTWLVSLSFRAPAGTRAGKALDKEGRVRIGIDGEHFLGHRLAWFYVTGSWPLGLIDHKDLNPSNNKWDNLRPASQSLNMANAPLRRTNTSGFKGILFMGHHWRRKPWQAKITVNRKPISLGYHATAEEAHAAYCAAAQKYFGEYARAS